ncbi:beta-ketoacyl synthase N-terminal-like domain-containing protein [Labedaea rhizosphaerae]|uniref:Phosphopantetheine binding protein n=1 Tax=Labedaea rhizosphaerae TaxID=598644 RepID=A0A4V3CY67_LABRH|nr:beta-ketoacyl synthase N-terminal-like domain-containing protein [Labedaea rhizosphaerae]TDP93018.1 phosphopantetheine binding protein [Labedaea rhizosphaerae]
MTDQRITDLLARAAATHGDRPAFTYLAFDGDPHAATYTWAELHAHAVGFARLLTERGLAGRRALLVYDTGADFEVAFLGCLLAGVTAVPAPPPRKPYSRSLHRLAGIQRDCAAPVVITRPETRAALRDQAELAGVEWLTVADAAPSGDESGLHPLGVEDLAYLQYTSGSTADPKGVCVTQADVLASCAAMHDAWRHDEDSLLVSWLPMFHDMGLVYCGLLPVVHAMPTVLMAPTAFAREPVRWLRAMHEFGGTHSIAPNFGFDLSARKITPAQLDGLDLSRWRVVVNASEPIRAESLHRFTQAFAPIGFREQALLPAYGLAEATLMVTSARAGAGPVITAFDPDALAVGRGTPADHGHEVVSCGSALAGFDVRVVDPDTATTVPDGQSGEVWVAGPSVTAGYLDHPDATAECFGAVLEGRPGYLRTGDIGFLRDGELYVTSRRKDLIIVAGRNHHPHDLEATVFQAHPALRPGCAAAFAVDDGAEEHVVVVQEIAHDTITAAVAADAVAAVRKAVAQAHDLRVDAVVLLRKAGLAKTSSGKIQRSVSKQRFRDGQLDAVASWRGTVFGGTGEVIMADSTADLRDWLRHKVSELTGVSAAALSDTEPLAGYGLGSAGAAELASALTAVTGTAGTTVPEVLLYDHPTIDGLLDALTGKGPQTAAPPQVPVDDDIAIVGIGCRVPGADSPDELWQLLRSGADAVREVPATRWAAQAEPALRWAGLVDDPTGLDTGFFGISPREATSMDPQQRMLLAVAWEAIEDAGLDPIALAGTDTGVFVGVWSPEFALRAGPDGFAEPYLTTGSAHSIAANRLSYQLDLHGPSMAVDTACSSSLVAVHLASRALRDGECSVALAGGANVVLSAELTSAFARAHLLSPTGRCRSFGAGADGYVRAEGAAVLVLKRLADALAAGDDVYAVVKGSALGHDGRTNGLTAPSASAQQAVIRAAHQRAGVRAGDIDFVEAHGSGTPVGDLIEATALGATVGAGRSTPCVIGSVKSSVGHLEAAAGVAGVIRAALALRHGELPPTLHVEQTNPRIDFSGWGLRVNREPVPLPDDRPALAGVSSFGFGGANAHVVLAQAVQAPASTTPSTPAPERAMLLPVSARSPKALAALAARYRDALADPEVPVAALCHAAGRRAHHDLRAAVVGADRASLRAALDRVEAATTEPGGALAFSFGEDGPAGLPLFLQERVFRAAVEACDDASPVGWSLVELLHPTAGEAPVAAARAVRVAVHIGLVDLLRSWGVRPAGATGTGIGRVSAAYALGALDKAAAMAAAHTGELPAVAALDPRATVLDLQGCTDRAAVLTLVGRLYEQGHRLDWAAVTGTRQRGKVPRYPWDTTDFPLPGTTAAVPVDNPVDEPAPEPAPAPVEGRDYRELVRKAAADLLGMPVAQVDNQRTFAQLGMDSLTGVDLHERLEAELEAELPQTAVLNHPSVARLADFLATHLGGEPAQSDEQVVDALLADLLSDLQNTDRAGGEPK